MSFEMPFDGSFAWCRSRQVRVTWAGRRNESTFEKVRKVGRSVHHALEIKLEKQSGCWKASERAGSECLN